MNIAFREQPTAGRTARLIALTRRSDPVAAVTSDLQTSVAHLVRGGLTGEIGSVGAIPASNGGVVVFYGTEMPDGEEWREWDRNPIVNAARGLAFGVREARRFGASEIVVEGINAENALLLAYYAGSASDSFAYGKLVKPKEPGTRGGPIDIMHVPESLRRLAQTGRILADARNYGRHLMNMPAVELTTSQLCEHARAIGRAGNCTVTVLDPVEMGTEGFDLTLAIGDGSNAMNPPYVVVLEYNGNPRSPNAPCVILVGKGVVHDSGGMNLKQDSSQMHMDMGGAATMIAAMKAIAELKLKVNVKMIVFCVQNAIGPNCTITGTPIFSRLLDKTVVIGNTDGEGRLGLAECAAYAKKRWGEQRLVGVDIATLTGLQLLFFPGMSTAWSTEGDLAWQFHKLGLTVGDRVAVGFGDFACRKKLDTAGGIYGQSNVGSSNGPKGITLGGSTIAFEFAVQAVVPHIPWIHVDMAGSMGHPADSGEFAQGGDCPNVITIVHMIEDLGRFLGRSGVMI